MQILRSCSHYMAISKLSNHIHPLQSRLRAFHKTPISQNPSSKNSAPLTTKYAKHHRGTMKGESSGGNQISFGGYALQALEHAWVTSQQIKAGRKAITGYARRAGKIWVRVIADKSVTGRPTGVRMGRGKGPAKYSVAVVKPGRILYEMGGVSEMVAKEAISIAASKLPMRTQFVNGSFRTKPTSESLPAKITDTHSAITQNQTHLISSGFSPICAQNNGLMKMSSQSVGFPTCVSGVSSVRAYSSFYGNQGDGSIAKGLNVDNSDGIRIGSDGGNTVKNAWQSVAGAESFLQQKAKNATEAHTPHVGGIGGLPALVGNVLSSMSMRFTKPLSVGNTIQAGSIEGQVVQIDHTATSLTK